MKRRKQVRIGAFALAVAMTVTMMPMNVQAVQTQDPSQVSDLQIEGGATSAEDTAGELDVSQFATKEELLDAFDTDETTPERGEGKVYFGQNGQGQAQEWWIAGKDPWNEEGLVLFAASPLKENQEFQQWGSIPNLQKYDSTWGCVYDEETKIDYVYDNHYGGSKLRNELKRIEKDSNYFSDSEQKLMQTTMIYTEDLRKGRKVYSTEDKLYAAYGGDINGAKEIFVGGNGYDALASGLQVSPVYRYKGRFWLRSPNPDGTDDTADRVLVSFDGNNMNYYNCNGKFEPYDVVPAFQLDTSNVLFGSKISSEGNGNVSGSDVFTLRYNAEDELGSAEVSADKKTITVTNAATGSKLVVQDKNGANIKSITESNASVSASKMNLSSFENCKVWLEKTDADRITIATLAKEEEGKTKPEAPKFGEDDWASTSNSVIFTEPDPGEDSYLVIEYSMDQGKNWQVCDGFFEDLEPNKEYEIWARYQANEKYDASEHVVLNVSTSDQYLVEVTEEIIDNWTTNIGELEEYFQIGTIEREPIKPIIIQAKEGYYFPETYLEHFEKKDLKGLTIERLDDKKIQITGTPSGDVRLTIPPATSETEKTYKITVTTDGNGTASASPESATIGTEVSLQATPNEKYRLKSWEVISGGITITDSKFTMPASDVEIKAIFEPDIAEDKYLVDITEEGNGNTLKFSSNAQGMIDKNTLLPVTIEAKEGYYFPENYLDSIQKQCENLDLKVTLNKDQTTGIGKTVLIMGIPNNHVQLRFPPATAWTIEKPEPVVVETTDSSITIELKNYKSEYGKILCKLDDGQWEEVAFKEQEGKWIYTFTGLNAETTYSIYVKYEKSEPVRIASATAAPKPNYTLTFNTNGGSAIEPVTQKEGEEIDLSTYTPSRSGYRFTGWYEDEGLQNRITSIKLDSNKTIYAGWTRESTTVYYTLYFETNGGNKLPSLAEGFGEIIDLNKYIPVREGYTFTGWYADAGLTERITEVKMDRSKTIYAGWEKAGSSVDTKKEQAIHMTVAPQERDLKNGSRTTESRICTLKLGFAVEDPDLKLTYTTSDPEVATVEDGKITYQGVGRCVITVTAEETALCKAASLEIEVVVGKLGTPTFTPSVKASMGKKAFRVTSSTVRGVDGWEVQYSVRADWWRAKTRDFPNTGTKLYRKICTTVHSNRKYYIHVRGYQIIDGEKVYSDWSPMKTIKTK